MRNDDSFVAGHIGDLKKLSPLISKRRNVTDHISDLKNCGLNCSSILTFSDRIGDL